MAKQYIKLQAYRVIMKCNKCGKGEMIATGVALTSNPPQYPHVCNNPDCQFQETFSDVRYPGIEYKDAK